MKPTVAIGCAFSLLVLIAAGFGGFHLLMAYLGWVTR